jgi:SAM-dependent methyltransferase
LNWIEQNKNICILDIGCGGGTGSIAFLETLIRLKEEGSLRQSLNVYCLGIDINENELFSLEDTYLNDGFINKKEALSCL